MWGLTAPHISKTKEIKNTIIMSKEYYKKKIIDLRASIAREKEEKKRDNEYYARLIKSASSPSSKASYRKSKIDKAASHDRDIEYYKRQIESAKESLARLKR
jgi:hypothetical protein